MKPFKKQLKNEFNRVKNNLTGLKTLKGGVCEDRGSHYRGRRLGCGGLQGDCSPCNGQFRQSMFA